MLPAIEDLKQLVESKLRPYEKYFPVTAFFGGFIWDNLTVSRIDMLFDNLQLLLYLLLLSALVIISLLVRYGSIKNIWLLKYSGWYPSALQFLFGGLFSVYVVFYFQSASLTKASLFLIMLVILFIANEFLKDRLSNTYLLLSIHFLVSFSYFIFALPVLFKIMNNWIFLLSGVVSLLFSALIFYILYKKNIFKSGRRFLNHCGLLLAVFLMIQLFYWQNWIPPVPLSLKDTGIYHHVSRQSDLYQVRYEKPKWYQFFKKSDIPFHYLSGDTIFCYASVFAPTHLKHQIFHQWQRYDAEGDTWLTTDKHGYTLTGGRDGGYRGYTYKKNISTGFWRVNVITDNDLILGRISFDIVESTGRSGEWRKSYK